MASYKCDIEWFNRTRELQNDARKWILALFPFKEWEYNWWPSFSIDTTIKIIKQPVQTWQEILGIPMEVIVSSENKEAVKKYQASHGIHVSDLCGACGEGRHSGCSGWCFCTCEYNRTL